MVQRFDGGLAPVASEPTLHAAAIHPQPLGDFADRTTCIDFQQRQNAPKEGGLMSPELTHVPMLGVAQGSAAMLSSATLTPVTADRNPFNATLILHTHLVPRD
jgi:hypothetical protein